jgi:hypothetical protein
MHHDIVPAPRAGHSTAGMAIVDSV